MSWWLAIGMFAAGAVAADDGTTAERVVSQEIGLAVAQYRYQEPGLMSLKGAKAGINYSIRARFAETWFAGGDARFIGGPVDYESAGTGSSTNHEDWYFEWRLLAGRDFALGEHTLSPYSGVGYRLLYNDLRGDSSTGASGYRRESRYLYLPIGVSHRMPVGEGSWLATTIEYDQLIQGRQESDLADIYVGHGYSSFGTLANKQRHGHGWRGSVMLKFGGWAMGPYASYWRISQSDTGRAYGVDDAGVTWYVEGYEPRNTTREAGFKATYTF